jgi:hypothetical protein
MKSVFRKSQTSTEYLILLAIVIVIAIVLVNLTGGFSGIGGSSNKRISDSKLASDTVGIESYNIGDNNSTFRLKNNYYDTITVVEFRVNQQVNLTCNSSNTLPSLPITLDVGGSKIVTCAGVNSSSYPISIKQTPLIGVLYIDPMNAQRLAGNTPSYNSNNSGDSSSPPSFVCNTTGSYHNGTGTAASPYGICTWAQLNNVRNNLSAYFILLDNLDSSSANYTGIGNTWRPLGNVTIQFSGNFNGNKKTISNLIVNLSGNDRVGLFGYMTLGNISNLGLINSSVTGDYYVGGIVGLHFSGNIVNSYSNGTIKGICGVGGLVGQQSNGLINNSYSTANINGSCQLGGLVGYQNAGGISNSYATGNVLGSSTSVGGLIGFISGSVNNSYSTGTVTDASSHVGGVVGDNIGTINNLGWWTGAGPVNATGSPGGNVTYNQPLKSDFYSSGLGIYSTWNFASIWQTTASYPTLR